MDFAEKVAGKGDVINKNLWIWTKPISHKRKGQEALFALILVYLHFRVINKG